MKILDIIMGVLMALVLATPILGATGVFPAPTADLYAPTGWAFMEAMMNTGYMFYLIAFDCLLVLICLAMRKTALAAIFATPLMVNIACFHLFINGGLFIVDASLAWVVIVTTVYFLWRNIETYKKLW